MSRFEDAINDVELEKQSSFINTGDLLKEYPDGVHVTRIISSTYNDEPQMVCFFAENTAKRFSACTSLENRLNDYMAKGKYNGDIDAFGKDLEESGKYLHVKISPKPKGKNYFPVVCKLVDKSSVKIADDEVIDDETGEVVQPAVSQDTLPF